MSLLINYKRKRVFYKLSKSINKLDYYFTELLIIATKTTPKCCSSFFDRFYSTAKVERIHIARYGEKIAINLTCVIGELKAIKGTLESRVAKGDRVASNIIRIVTARIGFLDRKIDELLIASYDGRTADMVKLKNTIRLSVFDTIFRIKKLNYRSCHNVKVK